MYKKAKAFVGDFLIALKNSNESVKRSKKIVSEIEPLMVRIQYVGAMTSAIGSLGLLSFVGLVIQKSIDGWFKLGVIQIHHVYWAVSVLLVSGIAWLFVKERLQQRVEMFEMRLEQKFDDMVVQKICTLDLGRITDPEFIELQKMAIYRGRYALKQIWKSRFDIGGALLGIFASVGILLAIDFKIIAIIILPLIPEMIKMIIVDTRKRRLDRRQILSRRYMEEYGWCLSDKSMSVQTKLFGFTQYFLSRYYAYRDKVLEELNVLYVTNRKSDIKIGLIDKVAGALVILYLGHGVVQGNLDVFKLMTIFACATNFRRQCGRLSSEIVDLSSQHKDCLYFQELMDTQPLIEESDAQEVHFERTPRIQIQSVNFAYPRQEGGRALSGCTFEILPGQKVALLGKNGCGKTTVLRMLAKVFLPESGYVQFDGASVTTMLQKSLHQQLLYITQETHLPSFTLDESITGTSRNKIDYTRLKKASSILDCDQFISKLPFDYQTQIGSEWPGGVEFSSGQFQRLKLVAALYRLLDSSTKVALFDEPMSHCDVETRERFYGAIKSFTDKTIIVVAHDLSCLPYFERLVVMDAGRVVEDVVGTENILKYQSQVAQRLASEL